MLGSVLTAQSLEPALDSVSPSLSAPSLLMLCLSLSLSKVNKHLKKKRLNITSLQRTEWWLPEGRVLGNMGEIHQGD